ncbi:MAG: SLBB domain-containing protein [Woeseiaceae bacterium]
MSVSRSLFRIPRILLLSVALLAPASAFSQTAEQLRQLEQLKPDQREAILRALGVTTDEADEPLTQPRVVTPRAADGSEARPAEAEPPPAETRPPLKPFGYELFAGAPTTFAPATDIPVPVDYVIGPGDTVELQLFGNVNAQYSLVVGRDGLLNVPELGPVTVAGLQFTALQETLQRRIAEQMIGVRANVTLGPLRSIRVFILGDAYRPGSYTVSALSTMTNALFVSGGINTIGTLRNIQLKRSGQVVTTLDLYDLLLRGDTSGDARLQPGDVIFIPPVGTRVGIDGKVRRPAIYELKGEGTIADLVRIAGGMLPSAYPEASQVERINERRERTVIDVDLSTQGGLSQRVRPDDVVRVYSVLERKEDIVILSGHVYRDGPYQWEPGMRLSDLIPSIRDLQPKADLQYLLIRRENRATQRISVLSANLMAALDAPGGAENITLEPLDTVIVFNQEGAREAIIEPIIEELRLQARHDQPVPQVGIGGRVRAPGTYPLESNMRISDLIRAGGYLDEAAYALDAELTRYTVGGDQERQTELLLVDLAAILAGDTSADLYLQPRDILNIKEIPLWRELEVAEVRGEVSFPGRYPIRRGERVSSLLQRAGGLTDMAFAEGAVFLRQELRRREQQQLAELAERLEGELQIVQAGTDEDVAAQEARVALLEQVRETEATGRLVIDLLAIVAGKFGPSTDLVLQDGDQLLVPRESQTVTIIGEVQFPTSHVYESGITRDDYIGLSGGTTSRADRKRIYVVRADGSVVAAQSSLFFRNRDMHNIRPGDTIVVPLEADYVSQLTLWTSITTILYNIGVAAAAIASFN